jgi:hypothetical protein
MGGLEDLKIISEYLRKEGRVIKEAPVIISTLILFVGVVISGVVFGIFEWHYSGQISTQTATIENQKSHIAVLEEENKGVQPQQAAINVKRRKIIEQLQKFYVEAGPFINSPIPKDAPVEVFNQYKAAVDLWANNTISWIEQNMGAPAKERFLDNANGMSLSYSNAYNQEHNNYLNVLARSRRNLTALIENPSWDKYDPSSR